MSTRIIFTACTLLAVPGATTATYAQDCNARLIEAMKSRFSGMNYDEFKLNVIKVFKMTREERESERRSNSLGLKAVIEAIPFGLGAESDDETVRTLSLLINQTETTALNTSAFAQLQMEMMSRDARLAYEACLAGRGMRLVFTPENVAVGEKFIASIEYMPTKPTDGEIEIDNISPPAGATVVHAGNLASKAKLKPFHSMSSLLKRKDRSEVVWVINLGGSSMLRATMPRIPDRIKIPPPPPPETATLWTLRIKTCADDDSGTDAAVRLRIDWGGKTTVKRVTDSRGPRENESDSTSSYTIVTEPIRLESIRRITLDHDNRGDKPGWRVCKVELDADTSCNRTWPVVRFTGRRWLASDEPEGIPFQLPVRPHDGKRCAGK